MLQQLVSNLVLLNYSLVSILSFWSFLSVYCAPVSTDDISRYMLHRLYSVCIWSIAIRRNNVFYPSDGSDVLHYVLQLERSEHAGVDSVCLVFVPEIAFVLGVSVLVFPVLALHIVGSNCPSV